MKVKTLYRSGNTVSLAQPDGEYTTLLRVIADDGYILKLADGALTNCIDCESSEGITEVADTMGRQMEMMGYSNRIAELTARADEYEEAMLELAEMAA